MTTDNILYDENATAIFLGGNQTPISARTLQRWRLEGVGPAFIKLGRLVRYRQSDLNNFLDENKCTSTAMNPLLKGGVK
ncbi:MAG: helix-turn-helix domain-containing protein [Hyphomicrobiales bacterium]